MTLKTDNYTDFIYHDLKTKGLYKESFLWEMVDHISCMIEPRLEKGIDFNTAYTEIMDALEPNTFGKLQHQSNINSNLKLQFMKKLMFILGALGTLMLFTGILFKLNHWPGASISIFTGSLITVLGFLPLFFIVAHTEQEEKTSPLISLAGYLTMSLLVLGPLFKIMHWPGASSLLFFGPLVLAVFFIPAYIIQVFRRTKETKTNVVFMLIIVGIGISSMFMLSGTRISIELMDKFDQQYTENLKTSELFEQKNADLLKELTSSKSIQKMDQLKNITSKINKQIATINQAMLEEAEIKTFETGHQKYKDNRSAFEHAMKKNMNEQTLQAYIAEYQNFINQNVKDEYLLEILKAQQQTYLFMNPDFKISYSYISMVEAFALTAEAEKQLNQSIYLIMRSLSD